MRIADLESCQYAQWIRSPSRDTKRAEYHPTAHAKDGRALCVIAERVLLQEGAVIQRATLAFSGRSQFLKEGIHHGFKTAIRHRGHDFRRIPAPDLVGGGKDRASIGNSSLRAISGSERSNNCQLIIQRAAFQVIKSCSAIGLRHTVARLWNDEGVVIA